ncbi:protein yceI precursor [Hanstruepera neustonica]|uniref:Protein yceI n=1 Tax=Hanstruepera neustonica TaxID=1445657 RepID=A0A2K1E549_9FLAO|nr:YceI family protein [Hanstruepera neustonica]PNQ75412.1 protein yceI precursor [Hanstruepera neustonica]
MKIIKNALLVCFLLATTYVSQAQTIDSNKSVVDFKISGGGIFTVKGTFTGMQGKFDFNESDVSSSKFDICIESKTLNTKNEKRDTHLHSADFFDVDKYPTICFKSASVSKTSDGYQTTGDMTIHGVTKTVTIPFTFKNNTFKGALEINRFDYNIGEDFGTFRVGETAEVTITCKVE